MEQKNNNFSNSTPSFQSEMIAQPAPLWIPKGCERLDFMAGMQYHAPFICTINPGHTDLEGSIICTYPPHFVFKIHKFNTCPIRVKGNDKELQHCIRKNEERLSFFHSRKNAQVLGQESKERKKAIKKIVREDMGMQYDQELDEPRIIGKVPGVNIYLELIGCLDKITMDDVNWHGEHGAIDTMNKALAYALNFFTLEQRRKAASCKEDVQLMPEWSDQFDRSIRPTYQPANGLGYTNIDPSRRFADDSER